MSARASRSVVERGVVSQLILASGSAARRSMLQAAGVSFQVVPANVNENELRAGFATASPAEIARLLARAKAEEVSRRHPNALVIGGDQVLARDGEIYTKAADATEARRALRSLAGRVHQLHSAVAVARHGSADWDCTRSASLAMRDFSDGFLDAYLAKAGEAVCRSVGAYELEGLGMQLFESIDGDYFTILGMPLLPLLAELRNRGILQS